jgi:hypothetical protein
MVDSYMHVPDLLNSSAAALPRIRTDDDFERYLAQMFDAYLEAVDTLEPHNLLCGGVRNSRANIVQLSGWTLDAVRQYLAGQPAEAYQGMQRGITLVSRHLTKLYSLRVNRDALGRLYRMIRPKSSSVPKSRLFHTPFELRHKVGQHRYGIPGFPCLYLGGSLELCSAELRIPGNRLRNTAIAEFAVRDGAQIRVLDFGFRPSTIAELAFGRDIENAKATPKPNPELEEFIVNYATCWPLIAASSIKVMHEKEPFVPEYIVPQMILQWLMVNSDCDGIRYFSTQFNPDPTHLGRTINYVFPAVHGDDTREGYSGKLKGLFELTAPVVWGPWKYKRRGKEVRAKEGQLARLRKLPL